jgi:hypothetical protein
MTMTSRGGPGPAELLYISERKLFGLARARGIAVSWFEREATFEGAGRLAVPVMPGTGLSIKASAKAERIQPEQRERAIEQLLARVVRSLEREGIVDLDEGRGHLTDGGWFRFHRRLRFGVSSGEYDPSLRALVMVDREAVDEGSDIPGLLMFGSPQHLRPPYYSEELNDRPGARSGSATGTLFRWLQDARHALEDDPQLNLDPLRGDLSLERPYAPSSMYQLFARDDWMGQPRFPELVDHASCEGVVRATFIASEDMQTIVMGSPLYVRMRAIPQVVKLIEGTPRRGLLTRLIHSRRTAVE